jgi:hypothetical protein
MHHKPIEELKLMNSSQVIANYVALLALMGQMREAAKFGEWELLVSIEQQSAELVAAMKTVDVEVILNQAEQIHKKQLINKILVDDDEIRTRVHAWMSQLELSMQSNRQEQRLLHAYGA